MNTFAQDLRYGFRMLWKSPGFTLVTVLALALGIGANTAIFSVVNTVLLRPLPYPNGERIVFIGEWAQQVPEMSVSYPNFIDWREQQQTMEQIAAFRSANYVLTGVGEPERLDGRQVSAAFFNVLGVTPALGRSFSPDEDKPGGNPVALISHGFWQRRLGGDPSILNKPIQLSNESFTVIGVLPQTFEWQSPVDVFVPIGLRSDLPHMVERGNHPGIYVLGLLKPNVSIEQARTEIKAIAERLAKQYPDSNGGNSAVLDSLQARAVEDIRPALLILLAAVGFVLLIACANVANLLLARAASRSKEIAIRTALGAGRMRIIRQLLTESLLLSMMGGVLGLLFAMWGIDALLAALPEDVPRLLVAGIGLDAPVLVFTLAVSIVTGLLFGLAPALQASKSNLNETLKDGGRTSAGVGRQRVRNMLVVSEVALSLLLLVSAGLLSKSFMRLQQTDLGFDPTNVLTLRVPLPEARYKENAKVENFWDELLRRVRALPGVESAGLTRGLPMNGGIESGVMMEGQETTNPKDVTMAVNLYAEPGYFKTMNIPLVSGRYLSEQDTKDAPLVVMVDEMFVARLSPNADPIGKRLRIGGDRAPLRTIVGVFKHMKHYAPDEEGRVEIYTPYRQVPAESFAASNRSLWLAVKTKGDPTSLAPAIRNEVLQMDKDQPISNVGTMERIVAATVAPQKFATWLLAVFAATAMLLAAIGIYGVMAYSVTQRTHEIGIRMALGAGRRDVLRMVVSQGMKLAFIGVALGLAGAFALTRLMSSLLYGVSATDPLTYGGVSLLLASVALLACLVPARKATKVDPMIALRYE
ncbi:MAG TPA: ABC transporter permease [Pyrinomonadaceae bacterium]|nr:ABC transporter permease [Pyrinomonadaceae bacterium]